ncbi:MAG: class I SAM-dependent methyltransferase [Alphaproteobacteria bacterium]|nr:class I SAM-dependent methyltransferase [Alphaproteobacteria bacterium]
MARSSDNTASRPAFSAEGSWQGLKSVARASWWAAAGFAVRRVAGTDAAPPQDFTPTAERPPPGLLRRLWIEAFAKDAADVAKGLYPAMPDRAFVSASTPGGTADLIADARRVEARRRRRGGVEARQDAPDTAAYPVYYRQNFHYQSGGWFTVESARRYEAQVEALFAGAAGPMRRRALSLLARAWAQEDHRGRVLADLACGSGAFLDNLALTFPRARLCGVDLSGPYLQEAGRRIPRADLICAQAERLPFATASLDAVTCVYLFHELPPRVRPRVAAEIARVLKPGGLLAFADSLQPVDEPRLMRSLEAFPAYFHEPFYASYGQTDLAALFAAAGLRLEASDRAFLTKALLLRKDG